MSNQVTSQLDAPREKRRVYQRDFKLHAVQRIEFGVPIIRLSRELGVQPGVLGRWVREMRADPLDAFRGRGRRRPLQSTLDRLRRENVRLKTEKDLLRKGIQAFQKSSCAMFEFIENHRTTWPVRWMCDVFDVSPSGYYCWVKRRADKNN